MKTKTLIFFQLLSLIPLIVHAANDQILKNSCREISEKLASVGYQECLARELQTSDGFSTNNKPILVKQYPPSAPGDQTSGKVLLIGGMHGDEYSTVTMENYTTAKPGRPVTGSLPESKCQRCGPGQEFSLSQLG